MVETAIEDDWVNCGDKMFLWFDFNARNWEFLLEGMRTLFLVGLLHSRMSTFFQSWGADGMSDFSPVQAVGPNDLRFKVHTVHTTCPLGFQTWSGNSCWRWRYPSELYQNFTLDSLFTANCLAIALIWLDLWLGPWLWFWLWQIKESQVSQVSPPFLNGFTVFHPSH